MAVVNYFPQHVFVCWKEMIWSFILQVVKIYMMITSNHNVIFKVKYEMNNFIIIVPLVSFLVIKIFPSHCRIKGPIFR